MTQDLQVELGNNFERLVIGNGMLNAKDHPREMARYAWAKEKIKDGDVVLELGCGSGYGTEILPKKIKYIGLDYNKEIIEFANKNFGDLSRIFIQAEISTFLAMLPQGMKYDVIIAFEILEHLHDGEVMAKRLKKYCKKLLCTVPYDEPLGDWKGPNHHKIHDLTENDFPGFKYQYLDYLGHIYDSNANLKKTFRVGNVMKSEGLMLMEWDESMDTQSAYQKDAIPPVQYMPIEPAFVTGMSTTKPLTKPLTKNFLITSHTEGKHSLIKQKLLIDLVTSLKTFFPDSYVMVASASDVPDKVFVEADYVQIDRKTKDIPYGNGELTLVKSGLEWLKLKGAEWVYKFSYDFIINETNSINIQRWSEIATLHKMKFVGTQWVDKIGSPWDFKANHEVVGSWLYYGNIDFLQRVFNKITITDVLEKDITRTINLMSSRHYKVWDDVFLYESADEMLGGTWEKCGDLVRDGGNTLKPEVFGEKPEVFGAKPEPVPVVEVKSRPRVLCYVCTKDRFLTTLPMTIASLVLQTRVPDHLIIYEDGEHKDLNEIPYYKYMFETLAMKGCTVWMQYEAGRGQNVLDQKANTEPGYDFVWRYDDDEVAEADTLERLLGYFENDTDKKIGAVAGFVGGPLFGDGVATGKLENIFSEQNVQWHKGIKVYQNVDHLHSSFLYRPGIVNFHPDLSPVSHRGETIFTASLKRAGYQLIVDQSIRTWHYRAEGGIRSHDNLFFYEHDEKKFMEKLIEWGYRIVVLDNGIGDHACFLNILPELQKRYPHLIIALCYPEVFEGRLRPTDSIISIGQAPGPARRELDLYSWMRNNNWKGTMLGAYKEIYLHD